MKYRNSITTALATAALLGGIPATAAMASNPNPDCQGNPHLCDDGTTGPIGPQGPQGPAGTDGTNGMNGTNGANGANGKSAYDLWIDAGNHGSVQEFIASLVGKQGEKGDQGIQGPQGIQGVQGIQGQPGADGLTPTFVAIDKAYLGPNGGYAIYLGDQWVGLLLNGANGAGGADGQNGTDGTNGVNGTDGTDGASGVDGTNGTNGTDGVDGTNGTAGVTPHIGDNGNWFIGDNDTGVSAQGPKGEDGDSPVFVPIAANADWGFPAGGYAIYLGDHWVGNVYNGVDGKDGANGTDGVNGTDGTPGTDGKDGVDGHDGQNGVDGKDGATGPAGPQGEQGVTGAAGANGTVSVLGSDGFKGATGAEGTTSIVRQPVSVSFRYAGRTLRRLTVFMPRHAKLVSVNAMMRGERMSVSGRKINVDLRSKPVGNYNITITTKFRGKHGKVQTMRTVRHLSVAMSGVTIS